MKERKFMILLTTSDGKVDIWRSKAGKPHTFTMHDILWTDCFQSWASSWEPKLLEIFDTIEDAK